MDYSTADLGVQEGKDIAYIFYQTLWRICKWQGKQIIREMVKETFKRAKKEEADIWDVLKILELERAMKISFLLFWLYCCTSCPILTALNLMIDIFNIDTLKGHWVPYTGHQLNMKSPLNSTKLFLRLVVCCTLPSWGQTKQTDDFWMLPKESCISLCAVIFNKAMSFSTHNQTQSDSLLTTSTDWMLQ